MRRPRPHAPTAGIAVAALVIAALASGCTTPVATGPAPTAASSPSASLTTPSRGHDRHRRHRGRENPFQRFHTGVQPGNAIAFATPRVGWMLSGWSHGPGFDDNLAAAPIDTGYAWPATRLETTTDGGRTWRQALSADTKPLQGLWGFDLVTARTGYAVGITGIERTVDGGGSWRPVHEPATEPLVTVDFTDPRDGTGLTTHGLVYRTTDGGQRWRRVPFAAQATSLCTADGSTTLTTRHGALATMVGRRPPQVVRQAPPVIDPDYAVPPVWSQLSCSGDVVWASLAPAAFMRVEPVAPPVLLRSPDGGRSWSTIGHDYPPAVHPLATSTSPVTFGISFPRAGWGLLVTPLDDATPGPARRVTTGLPRGPRKVPPGYIGGYLKELGATSVGSDGWILVLDGELPRTASQVVLLHTTDAGASWRASRVS